MLVTCNMDLSDLANNMNLTLEQRMLLRVELAQRIRGAQKSRANGTVDIISSVVKDLNNKISGIKGNAEMMDISPEFNSACSADDQLLADYKRLRASTHELEVVLGRYMRFLECVDPFRPIETELAGQIYDAIEAIRAKKSMSHDITFSTDATPGSYKASTYKVDHMVRELVTNAAEAMPDGGKIQVHVGTSDLDEKYIDSGVIPGKYHFIEVTDTGSGMDEETRRNAFEPIFTTKIFTEGRGLGLTAVNVIVTRCDGHIDLESAPGKGTKVTLYFRAYQDTLKAL